MSDRDKKEIGVSTVGRHEQYNPKDLRLESEIMYGRNTLVMFINSPVSVHAVTPRRLTRFARRYINVNADLKICSSKLVKRSIVFRQEMAIHVRITIKESNIQI